jgi:hypothetical protein
MASKRRIRRKSCTGKIRHASKEEARIAAQKLRAKGEIVGVYLCRFCNGWHVGHTPRKIRRIMRARKERQYKY